MRVVNGKQVEIRHGKLYVNGKYKFLKIGKPQRDFSNPEELRELIEFLPTFRDKNFDVLELNCYWHHLDKDGDGKIDVDLTPLQNVVHEISRAGLFASLSVETYGVGGGQIPPEFWKKYPEAVAIDHKGNKMKDDEYGYNTIVPSLFDPNYLRLYRKFITELASTLDTHEVLWCETTVEPQFIGDHWVDYSPQARAAYERWVAEQQIENAPPFPHSFPIPTDFLTNPIWNQFRAQWVGKWISEDALAFKIAMGEEIWIASDYLDAMEDSMIRRCGDPLEMLRHMVGVDIVQINWTWCNHHRRPNQKAYDRVRQVMKETGRDWAITEHMTINGTDYHPEDMHGLLRNTINNSTCFGWEFVDVMPDLDDPNVPPGTVLSGSYRPSHFSVYNDDWSPKPAMAIVDEKWDEWMKEIYSRETEQLVA